MASGTLERCSLHGWIPVFTVQGRWQTACMVLCDWAICWCQRCGSSGPWRRWGYGMGRRILWTTNTGAFYWWHFECTEIPDEILRPIVVPFIHDHHLMLQHDNARPHVARICTQFLEAENIQVLAWPTYSPDMSPIEHFWDALDARRLWQHVRDPANIQQLHTAIEEEWTSIQLATINNLINSMRRCVALREANGVHTFTPSWAWFSNSLPCFYADPFFSLNDFWIACCALFVNRQSCHTLFITVAK